MIPAPCIMFRCGRPAEDGDDLCAEHRAYFRRPDRAVDCCRWCGEKLVTPIELPRGYCGGCRERTPDERVALLARRRARESRRRVGA